MTVQPNHSLMLVKYFGIPCMRGTISLLSSIGYQTLLPLCFADSLTFMSPATKAYTLLELQQLFSSSLAMFYFLL